MRLLTLIPIFGLVACGVQEKNVVAEMKQAMAIGSMKELNQLDMEKDKDLLVRLYQVPVLGETCFIETHGICRYKYLISVSTFDEYPEINVFELSARGEVTNISWLPENTLDYVEMELAFNTYTQDALKNNTALENKIYKVLLKIDPKKVVETRR
jgi:hypothetical protein